MRAKIYECDDCHCKDEFSSYIKARAAGWAVTKDYLKCYCPNCAPERRRGKAKNRQNVQATPDGFEQIKLEI